MSTQYLCGHIALQIDVFRAYCPDGARHTFTFAKAPGKSASHLRVEAIDGPSAGKQGWMEFEHLRPRQLGELQ